ncbi:MAG TPA: SpoIIE family protein phosphatase [Candidatus Acidoferrales bacterium]|nr:SpoIIE family protein phosphatase [Candidatus Acidoferrales bacterium]
MPLPTPAPTESAYRKEFERQQGRLRQALDSRSDPRLDQLLAEVTQALERMQGGRYGVCESCHESIEPQTLAANPLIGFCLDHLSAPERRRLQDDLELAARVQARLLPERELRLAGWEVSYSYQPMGLVGGDYCDLVRTASNDFFFFLGDVSGKGVAASLLAAQLHGLFRTLVALELPLEMMIERANRIFCEATLSGQFATLVCGRASPSGRVEWVNAGHPTPLLVEGGRARQLESSSHPLGLFCDGAFPMNRLELSPRQALLLYTDGLVEATNSRGDEYGVARAAKLAETPCSSADALVNACLEDVAQFRSNSPLTDDLTVMALRRTS